MEAIKLTEPQFKVIPGSYDRIKAKAASLEIQLRALQIDHQRLQIELNRERQENDRLRRMAAAAEVLRDASRMEVADITALVCAYKGIPEEKLKTPCRKQELVYCRALVFYLCSEYGKEGTVLQGRYFGRDHTTVIAARDNIRNTYALYDEVKQDVDYLRGQIESILNG